LSFSIWHRILTDIVQQYPATKTGPGVVKEANPVTATHVTAGRPRDPDVDRRIAQAALDLFGQAGWAGFSMEAVARRAGVGKTAIYRRWSNKLEMVLEIVSDVADRSVPLPDTGSFADDLELLTMIVSRALQHRIASQIIPDLMAEAARNPQIAETLQKALGIHQTAVGDKLVGQAVARGELPASADPQLAVDLILGPLYWRLVVTRNPISDDYLEKLIAAVTMALQGPPPGP
jgi:AcrR family transcriptional regulator